jgi:RNA polymerase sigma-70 factor (ECF subfamily)
MLSQIQSGGHADRTVEEQSGSFEPNAVDPRLHREIEAMIPRLTRYARSLTHDPVNAEDLVQESLSRALEKIHLWRPGTDLRAWLFTIMHHQYINEVRRAAREKNVPLGDRDQALEPHQAKHLEFRDLARAFDALPSEQRSVIMLVAVDEMQYDEAAALLELPLGTVRARVSRGRDTLRRLTDRLAA